MNPNGTIPVGDGTDFQIPFNTETFYAFRSTYKSSKQAISLGILPSKESPSRAMNVIRLPNHEIWKIRDGKELKSWFSKAFPRLDFNSKTPLIEQEEFDRFAEKDGLTLPPIQYSPELHIKSPSGNAAVVILGDAAHTFPPDLGEGVNSGLEDVVELGEALSKNEKLGDAVVEYSKVRKPEVRFIVTEPPILISKKSSQYVFSFVFSMQTKAIALLATYGAPFQYGQAGGILTVKKFLWTANFAFRLLLNKLTFGRTPKQVALLLTESSLPYSVVWKRAQLLTVGLWTLFAGIVARTFGFV